MRRNKIFSVIFIFAALLGSPNKLFAEESRIYSVPCSEESRSANFFSLVASSSDILVATVLNSESVYAPISNVRSINQSQSTLVTVRSALKSVSNISMGDKIYIRTFGGDLPWTAGSRSGVGSWSGKSPPLIVGRDYLLFLKKSIGTVMYDGVSGPSLPTQAKGRAFSISDKYYGTFLVNSGSVLEAPPYREGTVDLSDRCNSDWIFPADPKVRGLIGHSVADVKLWMEDVAKFEADIDLKIRSLQLSTGKVQTPTGY